MHYFLKEKSVKIVSALFLFFTAFWMLLQLGVFDNTSLFHHSIHKLFGALYGVVALFGAVWGIQTSRIWGGWKSIMGRAILMFALGLLFQEFGQVYLSVIDYVFNIQGQYPSIGDIGFFGSIPFYIYGVVLLAKASGVKVGLASFQKKVQAFLIPTVMVFVGYYLFLQEYTLDWSQPIKIFLDFGYPLLQAVYVSLAILTYLLTRGILGGIMRKRILFILFSLVVQFFSEYTFLYQTSRGTWSVGGINDYMYLTAYFLMTLGLLQLKTIHDKLKI